MDYTNKNGTQLPTIDKVVEIASEIAQRLPVQHLVPYDRPVVGEALYILNRTSACHFTLKPNITTHPCLLAGVAGAAENVKPKWNDVASEARHFQNLLREENGREMEGGRGMMEDAVARLREFLEQETRSCSMDFKGVEGVLIKVTL